MVGEEVWKESRRERGSESRGGNADAGCVLLKASQNLKPRPGLCPQQQLHNNNNSPGRPHA